MRRLNRRAISLFVFGLAALLVAAPARAQVGVRAGVSGSPDQFYFGVHTETKPLLDRLTFRPNAEVGLGDGRTLVALNLEFAWWIPVKRQRFSVYLGGGPAANIYSGHEHGDDGGVFGGLNFLVGVQHKEGLFAELKVGAIDSPSVKFAVGYVFHK
jgi:hypothetical protein